MDQQAFEAFLHEQIPITQAMGFRVLDFSPDIVRVSAALTPNRNHMHTAFGGSIHALMTVCGWSMMFANFKTRFPDMHIVIQQSQIRYLAPIREDFIAECRMTDTEGRERLIRSVEKYHKGKLTLRVECRKDDMLLAEYEGRFVVTE